MPNIAPSHHPQNITEQVLGPTSIHLSWSPPPEEHHNGVVRSYRVNVTEVETGRKLRYSTGSAEIVIRNLHPYYLYNCTVTAVTVDEGPYSAVIAVRTKEAGNTNFLTSFMQLCSFVSTQMCSVSLPYHTHIIQTAPSAAPSNLRVTRTSPYSLLLRWNLPPPEHRNGIIRRYAIILTPLSSGRRVQQSVFANRITIRNLKAHTTYRCKVAAYTIAAGPFTAEVNITTSEDGEYHYQCECLHISLHTNNTQYVFTLHSA